MPGINVNRYIKIAESTGVFRNIEIDILRELLEDIRNNPDTSYILFEEKKHTNILGFVIFGKIPMTEFSWDIYWVVVDRNFQGKGIGSRLLKQVEDFLLKKYNKIILRAETSVKNEYIAAHKFYKKAGFKKAGIIPDFYAQNDGLAIFSKKLCLI